MSHLVPSKAHKPPVILRAIPSHNNIWLEISFPLNTVRRGGSPPLGEVCGSMAFCPDVVPRSQREKPLGKRKEGKVYADTVLVGCTVSPPKDVQALTSSTCEWDLFGKRVFADISR